MTKKTHTRNLGFWETVRELAYHRYDGASTIVIVVQFSGSLTPELIKKAIHLIYQRHPLLQSRIVKEVISGKYAFIQDVAFDQIPFEIIEKNKPDQWEALAETELHTLLETNRFLWRANLLFNTKSPTHQHEVLFFFHHAIFDGDSLVSLVNDFLQFCDDLINHTVTQQPALPFLNSIETLLPSKIDWETYRELLTRNTCAKTKYWPYESTETLKARHTRCHHHALSENQFIRLQKACKQHNVTINSALSAALLLAGLHANPTRQNLLFLTLVNLRSRCHPPLSKEHVGCYVTSLAMQIELNLKNNLWEVAKQYQQKLSVLLPESVYLPVKFDTNELNHFSIANPAGDTIPPDCFPVDFGITNLGKIDIQTHYRSITLDNLFFYTSRQAGDIGVLANIATIKDTLFIFLEYTEPLLSKATFKKITEEFMRYIVSV